ncbi:6-phosphogluconolactonase [Helicobacter salomonis]|uniref:6-phosphogluconolactonase n=1 Tax=Helicobacter salomonis TaxID=56878 RepID=UPI001F3D4339|nr:6-phosphogluconolactonase [Helicobacter salomonis]
MRGTQQELIMFDFFKIVEESLEESLSFVYLYADRLLSDLSCTCNHKLHVAFSGGKSPVPLLKYWAGQDYLWENYTLSLVDDRIVPPDHKDSNAHLIHRHFLDKVRSKLGIGISFMPLVTDASLPPEMILEKALGSYRQPDLAVLGMGLDGHTASLFPDAPEYEHALSTTQPLVLTTPTHAPHKRISMSLHALERCRELWLLISGEEKLRIFERATRGIDPKLPISSILHSTKVNCYVFYTP